MEILERLLETEAVTINYAEGPPAGLPLVFLHGGSARWQSYESIMPDLAARFHLYAPDFRGHGKSGWRAGQYRLQDFTDDTIAFLRQCVAEPAYLLGHSLGGEVALLVAAQYPDYVRAVAVGDAPLTRRVETAVEHDARQSKVATWRDLAGGRLSIEAIIEALKDSPTEMPGQAEPVTMRERYGEDSSVFTWVASNLYYNDPDMLTATFDEATKAGYEMEKVLPAIRCPVLLLQADPAEGGLMTDVEVARALPLLTQAQHVCFKGTEHILFFPDKAPVLQAIVAFFESL